MIARRVLILAASLLTVACGSLNVNVATLDPRIVEAETDRLLLRDTLELVRIKTEDNIKGEYHDLATLHQKFLSDLAREYEERANDILANGSASQEDRDFATKVLQPAAAHLTSTVTETIGKKYAEEASAMIAIQRELLPLTTQNPRADGAIAQLLRQRRYRQEQFFAEIRRGKDDQLQQAQSLKLGIAAAQATAAAHDDQMFQTLIGGRNITANPLAHAIASARRKSWAKVYDESWGAGKLGKLDIAIKMEAPGVFTIKGVTFDPSTVARVASKVTSQSLIFATQLMGVPIKTQNPTGDGAAAARSSTALATLQTTDATAEATRVDRESALIELATKIIASETDIDSGDETRLRAAVGGVSAKLIAVKERLAN